jgi:hypothetical protein
MSANHSFPTPEGIARTEQLGPHFAKIFLPETALPFHVFSEPDFGPPHDHPFPFTSHVLLGGYVEDIYTLQPDGAYTVERIERKPGTSHKVEAGTVHRILELPAGLCITRVDAGLTERTSGFYDFRPDGIWHRYWHEEEWQRYPRK